MAKEIKTASNIKDKRVGKQVINALKMIQHKLNILKTVPTNGIVLCSGDFKFKFKLKEECSTPICDAIESYV
jgi:peptide subunit release factor 1 (eRF1)